ncbi:NAD(P)/FAD-dependent oxidoreductase [Oceaniglobus roseus]|uniref:NAD(P)/FAD-dependent oxidoreductase n=1 Tax=Oceaniglobus roseus TaxID=1737570 RepID=UPI000C7F3D81|nr:FAD-dependent oxidoreductase [Kandeliimicrobium roseum]
MSARHVAVVGAGIVGVSAAVWLLRAGLRVTLVDRERPAAGASFGNGGVLAACALVPVQGPGLVRKAPGMLLDPDQPLFLKWRYLPRIAPFLARYLSHASAGGAARIAAGLAPIVTDTLADHLALAEGTGAERWIVPSDYLYVYRDRAAFAKDAFGWGLRRQHGVDWEEMEAERFRAFDPAFAEDLRFAVRMGSHGRITDPGAYVRALATHAEARGARMVRAEVDDVVREGGRVTGLRAGGETLACDAVLIATGVWSGGLAAKLGVSAPLESERGYHLELWEPSVVPRVPVMIAGGKFVMTPMEGRLRIAGVVEFGGTALPPSRAPFDLLLRQGRAALPGLTWARKTEWMGHRPTTADSLPVIGAVPGVEGAWLGFGHQHIGLTAGPKTGRLLAQMIAGQRVNMDLAPYAPGRFGRG